MKLLLEDRRKREEKIAEERRRREEEMAAERRQQQEQIERLVEESHTREGSRTSGDELKLSKLTKRVDIEAYLTTFERIMVLHGTDWLRWAYKLAPELTGKAQLAYAAMDTAASGDYES